MPNIGYGTNKRDRHVLPNGFKKVSSSSAWTLLTQLRAQGNPAVCVAAHVTVAPGFRRSDAGRTHHTLGSSARGQQQQGLKYNGVTDGARRYAKGHHATLSAGACTHLLLHVEGVGETHNPLVPPAARQVVVHNVSDLELLMMHNRVYCAEVGHSVSSRKRKEIVERAAQLNVIVTNKNAKLRSQEDE
jgi:large subunit ribosomal protein L32e